jgi:putative endonuclease
MKQPCVYIMASRRNGTLYTGVTSNLPKRAFEHREGWLRDFQRSTRARFWFGTNFTAA